MPTPDCPKTLGELLLQLVQDREGWRVFAETVLPRRLPWPVRSPDCQGTVYFASTPSRPVRRLPNEYDLIRPRWRPAFVTELIHEPARAEPTYLNPLLLLIDQDRASWRRQLAELERAFS